MALTDITSDKEQSSKSYWLHCVVMATDYFHHFKMMKRHKELRSIEMSPKGKNTASGSYVSLWPCPCRVLSGMWFWFLFANLSQFPPSRPRSKLISSNKCPMTPFTLFWLQSKCSMWRILLFHYNWWPNRGDIHWMHNNYYSSAVHMLSPSVPAPHKTTW